MLNAPPLIGSFFSCCISFGAHFLRSPSLELMSLSCHLRTVSVCSILRHSASLRPQPGTSYVFSDPPLLYLGSCGESKLNIVPSLADISTGNTMPETQALVAVPAIGMEALAVIPFHQKSHSEFARRRIRRPFSVTEVEALVQVVEKLGTGRFVC
jgi:hypothetical protein